MSAFIQHIKWAPTACQVAECWKQKRVIPTPSHWVYNLCWALEINWWVTKCDIAIFPCHLPFILAGMLFPQLSTWLAPYLLQVFCFCNHHYSWRTSVAIRTSFLFFILFHFLWSIYPRMWALWEPVLSFFVFFVLCSIIRAETVHST